MYGMHITQFDHARFGLFSHVSLQSPEAKGRSEQVKLPKEHYQADLSNQDQEIEQMITRYWEILAIKVEMRERFYWIN